MKPERKTVDLPKSDDVSRAIHLMRWARREGYRVGPTLIVGDVTMQIEDIRQSRIEANPGLPVEGSIYDGTGADGDPAEGTGG